MIPAAASFLAVLLYGLLHSLLAANGIKRRARRLLGPRVDRLYRLAYNLVGLVTFLPVLALVALLPGVTLYRLEGWPRLAAHTGQGLALVVLLVGVMQTDPWGFLGLRQILGRPRPEGGSLVEGGLYRWVRHPLYAAGLVFIWLTPVMTAGRLGMNLGLTLYIYVGSCLEERRMVEAFGSDYRAYQRQVPRVLPCLWRTDPSGQD
jgi:protein-S-isoprenylcysteine O-methyltransferase Ste14